MQEGSGRPPEESRILAALRRCWSLETSTRWTPDSPARGQCSVTALVIQDLCGGEILKTRVGTDWHFYNLAGGSRLDFTAAQFETPVCYEDLHASRAEAMADTTPAQYHALRRALQRYLEAAGGRR